MKGELPTREANWHDYFNLLVWKAFPRAKAVLNARFFECFEAQAQFPWSEPPQRRSAAEDALTLFDEGGLVLLQESPAVWEALCRRSWTEAFWERREDWGKSVACVIFGHALYEGMLLEKSRRFHGSAIAIDVPPGTIARVQALWDRGESWLPEVDALLAQALTPRDRYVSTAELTPLPLLGIPGWAPENEGRAYYDDTEHFRTERYLRPRETPETLRPRVMEAEEPRAHGRHDNACS